MRACLTTSEAEITGVWEDDICQELDLHDTKSEAVAEPMGPSDSKSSSMRLVDQDKDITEGYTASYSEPDLTPLRRITWADASSVASTTVGRRQGTTTAEQSSVNSGGSRAPRLARQPALRRRGRGNTITSFPSSSHIFQDAEDEEAALERKAREEEAKEIENEARQQREARNGLGRWKSLYRSNRFHNSDSLQRLDREAGGTAE